MASSGMTTGPTSPVPKMSWRYASSSGGTTSMNANRRMRANDISNSRFLSNTFMVARMRHVAGTRMWSVFGGGSTPDGTIDTGMVWPRRLNGSTTACPDSTVNSWPKARSKLARLSSSTTSHLPVSMASTNMPGRKIRPSMVGWRPPIVSNVVHSVVAVVGR